MGFRLGFGDGVCPGASEEWFASVVQADAPVDDHAVAYDASLAAFDGVLAGFETGVGGSFVV